MWTHISRSLVAAFQWLHTYGLLAPLVQFVLAMIVAVFLAERWQRWRQRRDFQYKTLARFSEVTYDIMDRISELLVGRGRMQVEQYLLKRREFVTQWTVMGAMRPEVIACYGRGLVRGEDYQGMFAAFNALRAFINALEPVAQETFAPEQEKFLVYRERVVTRMVYAMRLLPRKDFDAEMHQWEQRLEAARGNTGGRRTAGEPNPEKTR
jgi:hypothetical protein